MTTDEIDALMALAPHPLVGTVMYRAGQIRRLFTALTALKAERDRLKGALEECARETGGFADGATTDFLMYVPENVRLHVAKQRARAETAERERDEAMAEVERLRIALAEAREGMEAWGAYASAYFQEKHDLPGDLAKIDAALHPEGGEHGR